MTDRVLLFLRKRGLLLGWFMINCGLAVVLFDSLFGQIGDAPPDWMPDPAAPHQIPHNREDG